MNTGLLHLHNFMRWLVILAAIWAIVSAARGRSGNIEVTKSTKKPGLIFLIFTDLQLLLGLLLYFTRGWTDHFKGGEAMKVPMLRFYALEHGVVMLIAVILVHVGYSQMKATLTDQQKFNKQFWYFLIALLLMLIMTPWPFRGDGIGRAWM